MMMFFKLYHVCYLKAFPNNVVTVNSVSPTCNLRIHTRVQLSSYQQWYYYLLLFYSLEFWVFNAHETRNFINVSSQRW